MRAVGSGRAWKASSTWASRTAARNAIAAGPKTLITIGVLSRARPFHTTPTECPDGKPVAMLRSSNTLLTTTADRVGYAIGGRVEHRLRCGLSSDERGPLRQPADRSPTPVPASYARPVPITSLFRGPADPLVRRAPEVTVLHGTLAALPAAGV